MPDDFKGKGFLEPDAKASALPKKSPFEKAKAEAEAKRAREKAETAAVYEDFVKSFEEDTSTAPRASDGRLGAFGNRGGGFGGGARPSRHFSSSGTRNSGPGSLPPPSGPLVPRGNQRGFGPSPRSRDSVQGLLGYDQPGPIPMGPRSAFRSTSDDEDDRRTEAREAEKAAARYTLCLESLPLGTSPSVLKSLIPSFLTVDNVNILRPTNQSPTERKSAAAIITLASDTPLSDVNSAISMLDKKYLGRGHYLSIHKGHSSAAINSTLPTTIGTTTTKSLPFGAKAIQPTFGGSLNRAPPPGPHRGFAPPDSYGPSLGRGSTQVEVQAPSDIKQLRLIHKTLENLLNYGPEFEALLMSRPEVQKEEKWAWIWDARSPGGVYYRWKLWQIVTNPRSHSKRKSSVQKSSFIFEGGSAWASAETGIKFEYTTRLDEFVSEDDYNSSEEEMSDGEEERRHLGGGPPPEGTAAQNESLGYMNPLQKAKLTHLLARLPTTHAKLRRGDVARVTAFAIKHAGTGAHEVVDMIVLNILHPLAYTGANPDRETEKDAARQEDGDKDKSNSSKQKIDMSSAKLVGLYLISDILASSATSGVPKGWRYRSLFEAALRSHNIFEHLGRLEKELNWGRLRAEKWKRSVGTLLHLWEGWSIFQPANQEHFLKVLEQPPLTEEELQKESEKADAERAAQLASKSKSRWKTVDDDPASGKFDSNRPNDSESQVHPMANADTVMEDESMSDLDGVPMEDSDLEMLDDDGEPMDEDAPPPGEGDTLPSVPDQRSQPEQEDGQQEEGTRRPRRPRPKAEDMFASESE